MSYRWDYGNGVIETKTTPTTFYKYSGDGSYTVVLTVTDEKNARGSTSKLVQVIANRGPVASIRVLSVIGFAVSVESTSTDSDGLLTNYQWSWGDGSSNATSRSTSYIYPTAG